MPNITLSVTEETKRKMAQHPHIRWSNAIRAIIEQKLEEFDRAEHLAKKLNLTMADFKPMQKKIEVASRKHARELLNESNR